MHTTLEEICTILDDISDSISMDSDTRTYQERYGWNCSPLTPKDLAGIAKNLSNRLKNLEVKNLPNDSAEQLEKAPSQLLLLRNSAINYLNSSNCAQAIPVYISTLAWISSILDPILTVHEMDDVNTLPETLYFRLQKLKLAIDRTESDNGEMETKIQEIKSAHQAAKELPATIEYLLQTQNTIDGTKRKTESLAEDSVIKSTQINESLNKVKDIILNIESFEKQAQDLVHASENAYRITTSISLAGAFEERAKDARQSIRFWVFGLLITLGIGSFIGNTLLSELTDLILNEDPNWSIIWLKTGLTIIGLGAPIWFAWIATKQISYKFKLAEDYSYKAAISKAYEGYRKEASRIDAAFEARLFATALTRLEEAPLRLVDEATYGSPWAEFIASDQFQAAMDKIPGLKERFIGFTRSITDRVGGVMRVDDLTTHDKKDKHTPN